ncbi:MAG: tail fiber domain-containing protein [Bacteroidales bacterium]|nr:tail fiber domain-containing protein [Bacteroidales bacterium]
MKTKLLLTVLLSFSFYLLSSQVPQGFNYQALAGDASGNPIRNTVLQVKISILSDTIVPKILWEELHSTVKTNAHGVFSLVVGSGVRQATSTALTFKAINWSTAQMFLKTQIFYQNAWKSMGNAKLWSVPYAMVASNFSAKVDKLKVSGLATSPDSALFEVKNLNGQTVFAVYNEGVRVYVDDGIAKSPKGGFAIGSFGTDKGVSQNYLTVNSDSVRVYVDKKTGKAPKGGFAIGDFGSAKGASESFMQLTPDNYFIGHNSGKNITTGKFNAFLGYRSGYKNTSGSSNTFFGDSAGLNNTSGIENLFMGKNAGLGNKDGSWNVFLGKDAGYASETSVSNVFIGNEAGRMAKHTATSTASYNVSIGTLAGYYNNGNFNVFVGQEAGYSNEKGKQNVFIGMGAGYYNDTASYNVAIGTDAGYNNMGKAGVFIGNFAGYNNVGANYNVFIGNNAGTSTNSGDKNVILGSDAGYDNTTGRFNTFIGNLSGSSNTTGGWNVYVGNSAGETATGNYNTVMGNVAGQAVTGDYNTIYGFQSGYETTSGIGNAFFGHQSGHENISGSYNTYIGPSAGYYNTSGSKNVMIGFEAGAYEYGSNKLVIANGWSSTPSSSSLLYGDFSTSQLRLNASVGINAAPSTFYNLYVSGLVYATGDFWTGSDIRLKQNVKSIDRDGVIDKVKEMDVIKYNYNTESSKGIPSEENKYIGIIAQEIEKSFPELVRTDEKGFKAVNYNGLTAVLLQAIKDQQKQIDLLKEEVEMLKKK